jgi:uncharacterized membrane protein
MIQKLSFLLIGGGVLVALGFFLKWFFETSLIALGFRIAIAVVIAGILLLLTTVGWDRYRSAKQEDFEEVEH